MPEAMWPIGLENSPWLRTGISHSVRALTPQLLSQHPQCHRQAMGDVRDGALHQAVASEVAEM